LLGRREVVIPIGVVTGVLDGVRLNITKQQAADLPPVNIDRPSSLSVRPACLAVFIDCPLHWFGRTQ